MKLAFPKTLYLEGRPSAHPHHKKLTESLTNHHYYIDEVMRWQDKRYGKVYNLIAWFINAIFLPNKRKYKYIMVDNLHPSPVLMRKLGLLKKKQKLICYLGSHTLYFTYSGYFSAFVTWWHKWLLNNYDYLFCEGKMSCEIANTLVNNKKPNQIVYTFLGVPKRRMEKLSEIHPDYQSLNILFIANGPGEFRKFYKGLDLAVYSVLKAKKNIPSLKLIIAGDWDDSIIESLKDSIPEEDKNDFNFLGMVQNLDPLFKKCSLYLHPARGDAFPSTSIEAMNAGLVPILSEWTGTKEIFVNNFPELLVKLDLDSIESKILWYFTLSLDQKKKIADSIREFSHKYSAENSIDHFKNQFKMLLNES